MDDPRTPHTIRLQAAWEQPTGDSHPWTRRFGRPTGLEAGQQVWLVVAGSHVAATVALNGVVLPVIAAGDPRWVCDITSLLRDRNVLEVRGSSRPAAPHDEGVGRLRAAPATLGQISLEIVVGQPGGIAIAVATPRHRP
jgi:hypothetical protein